MCVCVCVCIYIYIYGFYKDGNDDLICETAKETQM